MFPAEKKARHGRLRKNAPEARLESAGGQGGGSEYYNRGEDNLCMKRWQVKTRGKRAKDMQRVKMPRKRLNWSSERERNKVKKKSNACKREDRDVNLWGQIGITPNPWTGNKIQE